MKYLTMIPMMFALIVTGLNAQTNGTADPLIVTVEKEESDVNSIKNISVSINIPKANLASDSSVAHFGIYVEDLTFPTAQRLGYDKTFGILITAVAKNTAAWEVRLQEDDVILEINGKQVTNSAEFDKIKRTLRSGDQINLKYWREGIVTETTMLLGTRYKPGTTDADTPKTRKKLSAGYGGGTWIPMWFDVDMTDINELMTDIGFRPFNEKGMLMQGFGGKGHIGKGYFMGGQVVAFEDSKTIPDNTDPDFKLRLKYTLSLVGFTIDKRIPITKNVITSIGVVLGGGSHEIDIQRNNDAYQWPTSPTDISQGNHNAKLHRGYLMVQPRAELLVRMLPWFGLRAEGGYTYGYAPYKGWRMMGMKDEMIEIQNSPDTKLEGFNITIGPWFGF
ncbi:MAG: PDZ domain-containing protein [Candidatus Cloacimonadaceae bacterium]|nr:PDZ domain-containing protein [Candidatus Cloacimonadaceae bacterium]